jgi:hypothetical protein
MNPPFGFNYNAIVQGFATRNPAKERYLRRRKNASKFPLGNTRIVRTGACRTHKQIFVGKWRYAFAFVVVQ